MSDYPEFTPTMEQVRAAYAHDPEAEYRDPVGFPAMQRENFRAFDRWLAAHDAEVLHRAALFLRGSENPRQSDNTVQAVRHSMDDAGYELLQLSKRVAIGAGVVAEKPEWGTALRTPRGELWDFEPESTRRDAEAHVGACGHSEHMPDVCIVVSRTPGREAGPWVPVKQEGAGT